MRQSKQSVVSQTVPSIVRSIAEALVIKDENLFCISHRDGHIPIDGHHGFGLYYNDCRYLSGYRIRLGETKPHTLVANASKEYSSVLQLTNEEFEGDDGNKVRKEQLSVRWKRVINARELSLSDSLSFQNFGLTTAVFELRLDFEAGFEDVFVVRGFAQGTYGEKAPSYWDSEMRLRYVYHGKDGLSRSISIGFFPSPSSTLPNEARFALSLLPQGSYELSIIFCIRESPEKEPKDYGPACPVEIASLEARMERDCRRWLTHEARVESDSLSLNRAMTRSFRDLRVLESRVDNHHYFAAGIPWFATLFGRDSLITAFQTLSYNPVIAEETLRLLAKYQGTRDDDWRDEAPGKILHELRFGELARLGEIPHTPYYGTVDATPLFLALIGRHARWTGDLSLFKELRDCVERALLWVEKQQNRRGFLVYESHSRRGLVNQGWKDSWDAIVHADGALAKAPIALVEVQGYLYEAKLGLSELYDRIHEYDKAEKLRREALELRERFNADFWVESMKSFALALSGDEQPVSVISSNAGHALWSGIADYEKAKKVAERLLENDLFSGWGIRTLSEKEKRYNPLGYHLGTVWPHDNSLIVAGFKRYGFVSAALKVFGGIFRATTHFENQRLPELFAGYSERDYGVPVHYPVACHPQAWAAGTIPYLMEVLLGLVPDAFTRQLRIVRSSLPEFVDRLEFRDLRVGDARVDLGFYRTERRSIAVEVLKQEGTLEVVVEPGVSLRN